MVLERSSRPPWRLNCSRSPPSHSRSPSAPARRPTSRASLLRRPSRLPPRRRPSPPPRHRPPPALARRSCIPALLDPANANDKAPDVFKAKFTTTKGDFVIEVHRDWAPNGADRFYNLVKLGFFDDTRFFRAIEGFMVQFGIHGDPARQHEVAHAPASPTIRRQAVEHARLRHLRQTRRPTRARRRSSSTTATTRGLDAMGFAPFGQVVDGHGGRRRALQRVRRRRPAGPGPNQGRIQARATPTSTRTSRSSTRSSTPYRLPTEVRAVRGADLAGPPSTQSLRPRLRPGPWLPLRSPAS